MQVRRRKPKSPVIRNPQFEAWRSNGFAMNERQMLEWCAAFMLLCLDPVKDRDLWYGICTKNGNQHPLFSYPYNFWWSLRFYGDENDWSKWRESLTRFA